MKADPLALPGDWTRNAACRDLPPWGKELFFPIAGETGREAKAICAGCPVRQDCLEWALRTKEDDGIWGGMTAPERRRIRRTADVQFAECRLCHNLFSYAGGLSPSFRKPNYCSDVCKTEDRRRGKRASWKRRKLGIEMNGGVQ